MLEDAREGRSDAALKSAQQLPGKGIGLSLERRLQAAKGVGLASMKTTWLVRDIGALESDLTARVGVVE